MEEVTLVLGEKCDLSLGRRRAWIMRTHIRDRHLTEQLDTLPAQNCFAGQGPVFLE